VIDVNHLNRLAQRVAKIRSNGKTKARIVENHNFSNSDDQFLVVVEPKQQDNTIID